MANLYEQSEFDKELKKINAQGKNLFNTPKPPNPFGGFKMSSANNEKLKNGYISYLDKMNAAISFAQKRNQAEAKQAGVSLGGDSVSNIEPVFKNQPNVQPAAVTSSAESSSNTGYQIDQAALRQADQKVQTAKAEADRREAIQAAAAAAAAAAEEAARQAAVQNTEIDPPSAEDTNGSATGSKLGDFSAKIKAPFWARGLGKWIFGDVMKDQLIKSYKDTHSGDTSEKAQEDAYNYLKMLENQYGFDDDELNEVSQQFLDIQGMNKSVYDTGKANAAIDYLYGVDTKIQYKKDYEQAEKKIDQYVRFSNWNGQQNDEFAAKIMFDAQNDGLKIRDLNVLANRLAGVTNDKEQNNDYANENLYKYLTWKDPEITALDEIDAFCNSFESGLTDSLKGISTSLMKVVGAEDLIPKDWQQPTWEQKKIDDVKEHTGFIGDLLLDVSYGVGNMAPSLIANVALPGSGLVVTFVGSAGQSYNQAIMQGHTETEATTYALLNAGLNTLTEKAFGFFGKGTAGNLTKTLQTSFGNALNKAISNKTVAAGLTKFFSNGSGEFVEEFAQQLISPLISEISFDGEQADYKGKPLEYLGNAAYSAFVSFFAGGIGGTVSESMQGVRARGNAQIDGKNFVNIGAQTDVKSASASIADTDMNAQNNITVDATDAVVKNMADLTGRLDKVRGTGETLGVSDKHIRTAQDLALLSHRDVVFTDGPTAINEDGSIQINKDSAEPMNEVAEKMIGKGKGEADVKQNDESQVQKKVDEKKQEPIYDREYLSKLSDDELNNIHKEMTDRYIEELPPNADGENYRNEVNKNLTGRESVISSIVTQYGEMNKGKSNGSDMSTPTFSMKDIDVRIADKTAFADNELKAMDEPTLSNIMMRLAELNVLDMKQKRLPQNTETYIEQVGKVRNKEQMISTIRQIQTELGFVQKGMTNTNSEKNMLKDNADDDTMNQVQGNSTNNKTKLSYKPSSGAKLVATPGKTTTILGNFINDMQHIIKELNFPKSTKFNSNDGGFNILNVFDNLYISAKQFWEEYNKPWLDKVIARRDIIILATKPEDKYLYVINDETLTKELTNFGREYYYLIENGYVFDANTMQMMPRK